MGKMHFVGLLILFYLSAAGILAQTTIKGEARPVATVTELTLESKVLGADKKVHLYLPEAFAVSSPDHTYPVVVVLEHQFAPMIAGTVNHLVLTGRMPETLVVTLAGEDDPFYAPRVYTNGSDYWPSNWKQMPFDQPQDRLLDFFESELFPYLKQHYRAADYRFLVGASSRAVLVLDSFCRRPGLFDVHVAVAAGDILGMGYREGETFIEHLTEQLQKMPSPPKKRGALYVASALSDADYSPAIAENIKKLAQKMVPLQQKKRPLTAKLFANDDHYAILLPAWLEVLEQVYPQARFSQDYDKLEAVEGNALAKIDAYFAGLSQEYGFPILAPADQWNTGRSLAANGRRLMGRERYAEAAELFARAAAYRPQSPYLCAQQAKALAGAGRRAEALKAHREALARAKKYTPDRVETYQKQLAEAETAAKTK
ncbi:alpha/beta hydrolase [Acanthopleuribacter pedis]|uniref:Esterase n=1 Tax=Acanthopleuribacter pedis TaxID=442870 RepID=A0A8J7Q9F6_9BACT|nr:alpha/beta hydrolase-fold protein [Acanthopleuribacter pedis]MBO1319399.1 hypothetical protein [Acanthopleuribacter pedis]